MNNYQVEHQYTILQIVGKINGIKFSLLIDPKDNKNFISPNSLFRCGLMACKKIQYKLVELTLIIKNGYYNC